MVQEVITGTILPALLSLLAAYAVYGIQKATVKVKEQTRRIQSEEQRALLVNALEDVGQLTSMTVGAIEQTVAKSLREQVAEGIADREDLLALGKQALEEITAAVRPEAKLVIEANYGSFKNYLAKSIEAKVLELKLQEQGGT